MCFTGLTLLLVCVHRLYICYTHRNTHFDCVLSTANVCLPATSFYSLSNVPLSPKFFYVTIFQLPKPSSKKKQHLHLNKMEVLDVCSTRYIAPTPANTLRGSCDRSRSPLSRFLPLASASAAPQMPFRLDQRSAVCSTGASACAASGG